MEEKAPPRTAKGAPFARKPAEGTPFLQALAGLQRKGEVKALWMLMGDDEYMLGRLVRALEHAVVPRLRDFNFQILNGRAATRVGECIALCEELPMAAERRLFWLRDVHAMPDEERAKLAAYLKEMPPSTVLLLTGSKKAESRAEGGGKGAAEDSGSRTEDGGEPVETGKTAGLRALRKAVKDHGVLVNDAVGSDELARWLAAEFKRHGLEADAAMRRRFQEYVGSDLATLETELEKLACYLGERRQVEARDLEAVATPSPEIPFFEIAGAVASGDVARALRIVAAQVEEADAHPLQILAFFGAHFRAVLKARALMDRGVSPKSDRFAQTLGKPSWLAEKDASAARRFNAAWLERALEALLRADQSMKRGKDPRLVLELVTIHLCRAAR